MENQNLSGLSSDVAAERLFSHGANVLPERKSTSIFLVFLLQFKSPFIYVLFIAAIISYGLGQTLNAWFILAVLLINALIGTVQEFSAERAAAALKKMVPSTTTVIRDGKTIKINSADVVPGDLIQLVSGDKVAADIQLITAQDLHIDESMLTGESIAAHKSIATHEPSEPSTKENNRTEDKCFAGTVIIRGRGMGEVLATGINTEIGRIAEDVEVDQVKPPLMLRIETFTLRITYSILILISLIFIITVVRGEDLGSVFLLGVALAVSAIPEGLPAAITVALAIGMRRMAKQQVIIRQLVAVEGLGSCTYIASDKTGTLTVNEMTIQRILLADDSEYDISGEGMDLHGQITAINGSLKNTELNMLCIAGLLANEAELEKSLGSWHPQGDMVDVAFLVFAAKFGIDYKSARERYSELATIPYESEHAYCASINNYEGESYLFVKGSVEKLLSMCDPIHNAEHIEQQSTQLAQQGYRVLGIACKKLDQIPAKPEQALNDLKFLGMVGMIDPLRPEIKDAVKQCKNADIKVAMITGDHPQTATALAIQAGIADENMQPVTGKQLAIAAEQGKHAFSECIANTKVFARISPHQKKQIVEQIIDHGEFVAVTGDGVNDAPALSHAHIGIAMGLRGTDVARESSDLILTDDNFSSIVQGVKQGRIVYNNIRKVIFLLISTGAAEITLVILSLLFATPLPLLPIQLLWLNLVTNGIQDVALAFEPEEGSELDKPPRPPNEPIFNRLMIERVIINAIVMGCLAFIVFKLQLNQGASEESARNITLLLMVLFENVHVLNSRSETCSIFRQYFFGNKFLLFGMLGAQSIHIAAMYTPGIRDILQLEPVTLEQWFTLLCIALTLIVLDESHKFLHNSKQHFNQY